MRYLKNIFISLSFSILTISCSENKNTESLQYNYLTFVTSTVDWNSEEYGPTRAVVPIPDTIRYIPVKVEDKDSVFGDDLVLMAVKEEIPKEKQILSNNAMTRGTFKTSFSKDDEFRIYAYYTGDGVADALLIDNKKAVFGDAATASMRYWIANNQTYFWPAPTQVITFYGIYPYKYNINSTYKTLTYTLQSTTASSQTEDLLIATSKPLNRMLHSESPIELNFRHILTAVQFKANADLPKMTIESIEMNGFSNTGTYMLPSEDKVGTWSAGAQTETFTASPSTANVTGTTNAILNDGNQTFFMIPNQQMGKEQKVVFHVKTNDNVQRTISASFDGMDVWQGGTKVTYILGRKPSSGYYLYTSWYDPDTGIQEYRSGKQNPSQDDYLKVCSYKLVTSGTTITTEAVPWKITGYNHNGGTTWNNMPSSAPYTVPESRGGTYTFEKLGDNGDKDGGYNSVKYTVVPTTWIWRGPRYREGTAMAERDNGTKDLSLYDCLTATTMSKTTSNCYIVNGRGTYTFPIVYGNGYVNGNKNWGAITADGKSTGTALFKDYDGNDITSPDITVPSDATVKILWMDSELWTGNGVVSNVGFTSDRKSITFTINTSTYDSNILANKDNDYGRVPPGNFVIGLVTNNNKVIWQWHINISNSVQANRNLGQVPRAYNRQRYGRWLYLRIQQVDGSGNPIADSPSCYPGLYLYNNEPNDSASVRSLNYVWGLPYPRPATGQNTLTTPKNESTPATTMQRVIYPNGTTFTFFPSTNRNKNHWNYKYKTIFDPSPKGYRVPKNTNVSSLSIPSTAIYSSGWVLSDGYKWSVTTEETGRYMTATTNNNSQYYYMLLNKTRTIERNYTGWDTQGMIRPVIETTW